jgi:hypothetical protein
MLSNQPTCLLLTSALPSISPFVKGEQALGLGANHLHYQALIMAITNKIIEKEERDKDYGSDELRRARWGRQKSSI